MQYKIKNKKIRLIELFAGYGSQALALRDIGADFERWKVVEFDRFAIASYNAIHDTNFPTIDIRDVGGQDLQIVDTDKYEYIMFYSFPCQDLSVAGLQRGMDEDSETRSALLWQVKRILQELCDGGMELPQILIMENVTQVHSTAVSKSKPVPNMANFQKWLEFLESIGYRNYYKDLNAKDFGVAQSRNRCFCVSLLNTDDEYIFPEGFELTKTIRDYLETSVDERFYIESDKARYLIDTLIKNGKLEPGEHTGLFYNCGTNNPDREPVFKPGGVATSLLARDYKGWKNHDANGVIEMNKCEEVRLGNIFGHTGGNYAGNVYDENGLCPTMNSMQGGYRQPIIPSVKIVAQRGRDNTDGGRSQRLELRPDDCTNCITTIQKDNLLLIKQATKSGYIECEVGGVANLSYPTSKTRRGRVIDKGMVCPNLMTESIPSVLERWIWTIDDIMYLIRLRKLTPRECWRLMGVDDADFEAAQAVNSNTQLYKQAGNSIVKDVLCHLFLQLL